MKKRPYVAIINTLEAAGANIVDDTTGLYWSVMKASADATALATFQYGSVLSYDYVSSEAENRQVVLLDAGTSKETIVASTSYAIQIGNPEQDYESHRQHPIVHSVTSDATLSGTAATDRLNVYQALAAKVNAYAGNNATASHLFEVDFTAGTDTADGTPTIGATYTQATSSVTAVLAKVVLSSGTWAGDDAAGTIWLYSVSDESAILSTAVNWTGETTITLTQTNATLVDTTGLAIIDDAGYFTSKIGRGGANYVGTKRGFATAVVEVSEAPVYPIGIGSVMSSPVFDHSKQDVVSGDLEYDFQAGDAVDTAKTYRKYILVYKGGDEEALGATTEEVKSEVILFVDESNSTNLTNFHNALAAAAVK